MFLARAPPPTLTFNVLARLDCACPIDKSDLGDLLAAVDGTFNVDVVLFDVCGTGTDADGVSVLHHANDSPC